MHRNRAPGSVVTGLGLVELGLTLRPWNSQLGWVAYAAEVGSLCSGNEWTEGSGYHVEVVRLYSKGTREPLKTLGWGEPTLEQDREGGRKQVRLHCRRSGNWVGRPRKGTLVLRPHALRRGGPRLHSCLRLETQQGRCGSWAELHL